MAGSLSLSEEDVIFYGDRVIVPQSLRPCVLDILQSAHQGTSGMESRAQVLIFWPGISSDIKRTRDECLLCCKNAPSQPNMPASESQIPSTLFVSNHHYLIVGDRLSGWVEVFTAPTGSKNSGSSGLVSHLRSFFITFGVPHTFSSDGWPEFIASNTEEFFKRWGVHHRISSSYFPQSNGRAEVAVKKVKWFLVSCIHPSGSLNTDAFRRGMLHLRNTPDPEHPEHHHSQIAPHRPGQS